MSEYTKVTYCAPSSKGSCDSTLLARINRLEQIINNIVNNNGANSPVPNLQKVTDVGNTSNRGIFLSQGSTLLFGTGITPENSLFLDDNLHVQGITNSNRAFELDTSLLEEAKSFQLPNNSGRFTLSVNGKFPNEFGDIAISDEEGNSVFNSNIVVKLLNNANLGKYKNGDIIPSMGKTYEEVLTDIAQEAFPAVATLTGQPAPSSIEVGTTVNITLTSSYTQNDGDPLGALSLKKNGTEISTTSPYTNTGVVITKTPTVYQAVYNTNVLSNTVTYTGLYKIFLGGVATAPTTSAEVRALGSVFENQQIILNTGTTFIKFAFWLPSTRTLQSVVDLDALNLNITSEYISSSLSVNDAGGTPIAGTLYVKQQSVTYTTNHRHLITIS